MEIIKRILCLFIPGDGKERYETYGWAQTVVFSNFYLCFERIIRIGGYYMTKKNDMVTEQIGITDTTYKEWKSARSIIIVIVMILRFMS